jgi:integrase
MGKLTSVKVKNAAPGRYSDGEGLMLLVKETGARSYVVRVQAEGKRRDIGLGSAETTPRTKEQQKATEGIALILRKSLTLAEARDKADAYRRMAKAGIDPVEERKRKPAYVPNFEKAARDCHEELKAGWRNKRHTDSWLACLVTYVFPVIGTKPVDVVDSIMVRDLLAPIWIDKAETSRRILQRIGVVLDFAHIKGWKPTETTLKSVRKGLPRQPRDDSHFEAMPYADVPEFMKRVRSETQTAGRDALQFTVLTAVRSNETRFAKWPEIDLKQKAWTIPGSRMKTGQTHLVPLSPAAIEILERRLEARNRKDGLVFFSNPDKVMSDMTMTKILRDMEIKTITVHGFRSAFTDWAAEETSTPKEVVDKALAHKLPDKVEAAYRRTDFFERRRVLMTMWADYLAGVSSVVRMVASS